MASWKCKKCGYIMKQADLPDECIRCSASKEDPYKRSD